MPAERFGTRKVCRCGWFEVETILPFSCMQAGGVGDNDLEQKAAATLRIERAAAAAAAAAGAAGAEGSFDATSTSTNTEEFGSGSFDGDSMPSNAAFVAGGQAAVSTSASMHGSFTNAHSQTGGSVVSTSTVSGRVGTTEYHQGTAGTDMHGDDGDDAWHASITTARSRLVRLPADEQPHFEVEEGVVKNATHELVSADDEGSSDPALEAQAGTAAPMLRSRTPH